MPWKSYVVEVEWMDGRIEPFPVFGPYPAQCEKVEDGILYLFRQNGEMAPIERVASIPLCNVRQYGEKAK